MNNKIAELLGWYFGDGCLSTKGGRNQFSITGDLSEELQFYREVIVPTFNQVFKGNIKKEIMVREYPSVGVCGIYISGKDFVQHLVKTFQLKPGKKLFVNLPNFETIEQKKYFIRGLFDTDGSIYFGRSHFKTKILTFCNTFHYKPIIKLATISQNLIYYVYSTLKEMGFSPRLYTPRRQRDYENIMYSVVLDLKDDVNRWIDEIGFLNPKHKTKIKIWKQFNFCPPYTTIKDRIQILTGEIDPYSYYLSKKENDL
jgi:hypothetical protein